MIYTSLTTKNKINKLSNCKLGNTSIGNLRKFFISCYNLINRKFSFKFICHMNKENVSSTIYLLMRRKFCGLHSLRAPIFSFNQKYSSRTELSIAEYGFKLNWDKMGYLVKSIESTQKTANKQITEF